MCGTKIASVPTIWASPVVTPVARSTDKAAIGRITTASKVAMIGPLRALPCSTLRSQSTILTRGKQTDLMGEIAILVVATFTMRDPPLFSTATKTS